MKKEKKRLPFIDPFREYLRDKTEICSNCNMIVDEGCLQSYLQYIPGNLFGGASIWYYLCSCGQITAPYKLILKKGKYSMVRRKKPIEYFKINNGVLS